jgi:hypothetical protein
MRSPSRRGAFVLNGQAFSMRGRLGADALGSAPEVRFGVARSLPALRGRYGWVSARSTKRVRTACGSRQRDTSKTRIRQTQCEIETVQRDELGNISLTAAADC